MRSRIPWLLPIVVSMTACGLFPPPSSPPPPRFPLYTQYPAAGLTLPDPGVSVSGITGSSDPAGQLASNFTVQTDSNGYALVQHIYLPATWGFSKLPSANCPQVEQSTVSVSQDFPVHLTCQRPARLFTVAPSAINGRTPPASLTLSGGDLNGAYGLPQIDYYDENGEWITRVAASSVTPDGYSVTFPAPAAWSLYSGTYAAVARNDDGTGNFVIVGAGAFDIYGNPPPPPPPPDDGGCGGRPICMDQ